MSSIDNQVISTNDEKVHSDDAASANGKEDASVQNAKAEETSVPKPGIMPETDKMETESANEPNSDELAYTKREEFTSENFKVEFRNLGIFGIYTFKKFLKNRFQLEPTKIKSPTRRDFAFVCFRSQEDQEKALNDVNGVSWRGRTLRVTLAKPTPDPLTKRRHEEQTDSRSGGAAKKPRTCQEATCPLADIKYEDQLKHKQADMEECLKSYGKELVKINPCLKNIVYEGNGDLPCKFLGIKGAPNPDGYRNKSEFAIGKNKDGDFLVGFRLGSYVYGSVDVGSVKDLPHIPIKMKKSAEVFEEYLRQSKFLPFNPENNSGHFRQLGVRVSESSGEVMIIVGIYSKNLNETELAEVKSELKSFYEKYDKTQFDCTSLYYQDLQPRRRGETCSPVEHLSGETYIHDEILGKKFRISPQAFFQVNTKGADVLYTQAIELAKLQSNSTVLDICCGTGTIGICFANHCKEVLGVDIVPESIKDAEFNAEANSITNCKYFTGSAEDYITYIVKQATYNCKNKDELDLVAIVDPPRGGLRNSAISAIRGSRGLNRLVYLACNARSAQRNWIDLARPESKLYKGCPFVPKIAIAVDMFPHTAHAELVILFERSIDPDNETEPEDVAEPEKPETKNVEVIEKTD